MIMSSKGTFLLAILYIVLAPGWVWAENTAMGILSLCVGIVALIAGFVRRNKEKKSK